MARPNYKPGEQTADERILEAFWALLAEKPYDRISVGDVASRAEVSRNTFYYHFKGLEDLASVAVAQLSPVPLFRELLMEGRCTKDAFDKLYENPESHAAIARLELLLGDNSTIRLHRLTRSVTLSELLRVCEIDDVTLTDGELASLSFAVGGILSVIGDSVVKERSMSPMLTALGNSEVAGAALSTLVDTIEAIIARNKAIL